MKKLAFLLAMVLGTINMYAQDYDLQGLAKACEEYSTNDSFYPTMSSFHDGLAAVSKDGKWGYIDKNGNLAIPLQYDRAKDFREGKAAVLKDGKWGYIEKDGSFLIQPRFTDAFGFKDGLACVGNTFIDLSGIPIPIEIVILPVAVIGDYDGDYDPSFCEGLACVAPSTDNPNGKYCYIDERGQIKIPCKYDNAFNFKDGVACVGNDKKFGYIDMYGRTVIPMIYDESCIGYFCSDGLIRVAKKGEHYDEWGYLDKSGRTVIPCKYSYASNFSEGVAFVEEFSSDFSSKWTGFIDTKGNKLIKCNYNFEKGFKNGMCVLSKEGKFSYANKSFKLIAPFEYDKAEDFSEGLGLVKIGDKWGYIDKQGNSTFNPPSTINTPRNTAQETFDVIETLPSFKGGQEALNRWISENMQYPEEAMRNNIKGRVVAKFYVEKDGSITNVEIVKSVHPLLDNETIRLLSSMPKWIPGTQNGEPVRVKYTVPLTFNFTEE